jgi:hypothetical protein
MNNNQQNNYMHMIVVGRRLVRLLKTYSYVVMPNSIKGQKVKSLFHQSRPSPQLLSTTHHQMVHPAHTNEMCYIHMISATSRSCTVVSPLAALIMDGPVPHHITSQSCTVVSPLAAPIMDGRVPHHITSQSVMDHHLLYY